MRLEHVTIEELGPMGDGIHFGPKGKIYVEQALPGDVLTIRVARDSKGIQRGEIQKIEEPSSLRQTPPCRFYDRCGGCSLQHLKEKDYREWKVESVRSQFRRQKLRPQRWLEPIFLTGHNRRRVTFSALKLRAKLVLGYYGRRSDRIAEIDDCLIAHPSLFQLRAEIRPHLLSILPEGEAVDIFLQKIEDSVEIVFTGKLDRKNRAALEKFLEIPGVVRIGHRSSYHGAIEILASRSPLKSHFGKLAVSLPPAAFLQPTPEGERALQEAVLRALPATGKFADLFSGCGTFTGPLLERGPVDAFESEPDAVQALSKARPAQALRVFRRDLFRKPLRREELKRYDAIVFDPPRAGCLEQAAEMARGKSSVLVGVSCNPATFARDARILEEGGYYLQTLQVVDQFVWSHHTEVIGVFTKGKRGDKR